VAPEIMREQGYNTKADIFSLGSLLFNLLTGRFLFKGADKYELLAANKNCDLSKVTEYLT
jgi:serine/threonine protein kinase